MCVIEQQEIAEEKVGTPLTWEDTRKMKYTWRVCQETMRLQPPVQMAFRRAIQEFEYEGHTIPKGWSVSLLSLCHANFCFHQRLPLLVDESILEQMSMLCWNWKKYLKLSFLEVKIAFTKFYDACTSMLVGGNCTLVVALPCYQTESNSKSSFTTLQNRFQEF